MRNQFCEGLDRCETQAHCSIRHHLNIPLTLSSFRRSSMLPIHSRSNSEGSWSEAMMPSGSMIFQRAKSHSSAPITARSGAAPNDFGNFANA